MGVAGGEGRGTWERVVEAWVLYVDFSCHPE